MLITIVMALYTGTKSKVRTEAGNSDQFDISVGVHQGSTLSPLLFITVLEEATRECRGEGPWELLYADDLVLTAETKEEVTTMFNRWKAAMERRGLKINMSKTMVMTTGKEAGEVIQSGRWPCGSCGRGVGANSILCQECGKWCHKRCSGLRRVTGVQHFVCPGCVRRAQRPDQAQGPQHEDGTMDVVGGRLREVDSFCYLGNIMDCEAGLERAVRARVAAAWMKWREVASLLVNRSIPVRRRSGVYIACIRSVMLYGAETWALTDRLMSLLRSCDRRMLRYVAGVIGTMEQAVFRWQRSVGWRSSKWS